MSLRLRPVTPLLQFSSRERAFPSTETIPHHARMAARSWRINVAALVLEVMASRAASVISARGQRAGRMLRLQRRDWDEAVAYGALVATSLGAERTVIA